MEYNINEMIEKTQTMENVSVGGSACYNFGDVVLVKYTIPTKYGIARPNEEEIFNIANEKNNKGVNTPKHLAIKREVVGNIDICWVLQEKAKGFPYLKYCRNDNDVIQLDHQRMFANLDDVHYEKLAVDLKELMYVGIELKPKNIFFDVNSNDGGFTIIDLLKPRAKTYRGSLSENANLYKYMTIVFNQSKIRTYLDDIPDKLVQLSDELTCKQYLKCFNALMKVIPEFKVHSRWILRSLDKKTLEYFKNNGILFDDLILSEQEEIQFQEICDKIKNDSIEKIRKGQYTYSQIGLNVVRIGINSNLLVDAYKYSSKPKIKRQSFDDEWEYEMAVSQMLEDKILNSLKKDIEDLALKDDCDQNIYAAFQEINSNNRKF